MELWDVYDINRNKTGKPPCAERDFPREAITWWCMSALLEATAECSFSSASRSSTVFESVGRKRRWLRRCRRDQRGGSHA